MPMVILKPALGNPTPDGSASERIWHVWFFLQFSNVYAGNAEFLERHVFWRDGDDEHIFGKTVHDWVQTGNNKVVKVVKGRLLFAALTRKEMNCYFNKFDGRRQTGSVDADAAQTDECEVHEGGHCAEEDEGGNWQEAAAELPPERQQGLPRIAFNNRWVDTMLAMQEAWWQRAGECAAVLVLLLAPNIVRMAELRRCPWFAVVAEEAYRESGPEFFEGAYGGCPRAVEEVASDA